MAPNSFNPHVLYVNNTFWLCIRAQCVLTLHRSDLGSNIAFFMLKKSFCTLSKKELLQKNEHHTYNFNTKGVLKNSPNIGCYTQTWRQQTMSKYYKKQIKSRSWTKSNLQTKQRGHVRRRKSMLTCTVLGFSNSSSKFKIQKNFQKLFIL